MQAVRLLDPLPPLLARESKLLNPSTITLASLVGLHERRGAMHSLRLVGDELELLAERGFASVTLSPPPPVGLHLGRGGGDALLAFGPSESKELHLQSSNAALPRGLELHRRCILSCVPSSKRHELSGVATSTGEPPALKTP